jgi:hypothetical protein
MAKPHTDLLDALTALWSRTAILVPSTTNCCQAAREVEFPGSGATLCLIHVASDEGSSGAVVYSGANRSLGTFMQREFHPVTSALLEVTFGLKVAVWGCYFFFQS